MRENFLDSSFFALNRVIDVIYQDEEKLSDILYFVVSLASEITGAKGSTIRVLEHGTFGLKVVTSHGLSKEYLESGAIDYGKSVTEIMQGDIIIINDFENDSRIQNLTAAKKEGVNSVIGIPFTVNDTTYSILRTYYSFRKVPTQDEIAFLNSLGKLSCLAIERAAMRSGLG
ncbi:MAG TPA: GAF domain-containing protein [Deltaproteobacteria bacterium]|nr:GAF domain-containing protein [Deltaproteobacteria bacterium]